MRWALAAVLLVACTGVKRAGPGVHFLQDPAAVAKARRDEERAYVQSREEANAREEAARVASLREAEERDLAERRARAIAERERADRQWQADAESKRQERALLDLVAVLVGRLALAEFASAELCRLSLERTELKAAMARERRVLKIAAGPVDHSDLYELADEMVSNDERSTFVRKRMRDLRLATRPCIGIVNELARCFHDGPCSARAEAMRVGLPTARALIDGHSAQSEQQLREGLEPAQQADAEARAQAIIGP